MAQDNPYTAPTAEVSDFQQEEGFGDLKIFTSKGRLGRIRYLLYTMGVGLVGMLIAAGLAMIPVVGPFLAIALYIGVVVVSVFLTIQRCHDFNKSGWFSLLMLIPIVSLIFYFIPGTKGTNRFGLEPPPNSTAAKVMAFVLLALFILGIVAAIALPAMQGAA